MGYPLNDRDVTQQDEMRESAVHRLKARRGFRVHVAVYLIVNALLVIIWGSSETAYFWPGWAIFGWGIGLALHGWSIFLRTPISEDEIRREMEQVN